MFMTKDCCVFFGYIAIYKYMVLYNNRPQKYLLKMVTYSVIYKIISSNYC